MCCWVRDAQRAWKHEPLHLNYLHRQLIHRRYRASVGVEYNGCGHMRTGKFILTGKIENWVGVIMGNRHGPPVAAVCPRKPRHFDIVVTQSPMRYTSTS